MNKNILILTGSPRPRGNCNILADVFIEALNKEGHTVERFDAGNKKIRGCMACKKCYSKDGMPCIYGDDFNLLAPMVERADLLVLVTPLYWFSFPAQIKAAIDKMYSLFIGKRPIAVKETLLMCCAETSDMADFDGIIRSWQLASSFLKWKMHDNFLVPKVDEAGDILKTDALERARQLAATI